MPPLLKCSLAFVVLKSVRRYILMLGKRYRTEVCYFPTSWEYLLTDFWGPYTVLIFYLFDPYTLYPLWFISHKLTITFISELNFLGKGRIEPEKDPHIVQCAVDDARYAVNYVIYDVIDALKAVSDSKNSTDYATNRVSVTEHR